jgi:virginiamycin B lyase
MCLRQLLLPIAALCFVVSAFAASLDPEIHEYDVPTAKSRPHDSAVAPDGSFWCTGEAANKPGRLDPNTAKIMLGGIPTPHAVPYGIVILPDNTSLFCEFGSNKLASVDRKTMQVCEYALPTSTARPRHIALAPGGSLYYTDYARGYLRHFDPSHGVLIKEWQSPGGSGSEPHGIAISKDGEVWNSESGVAQEQFHPAAERFATW